MASGGWLGKTVGKVFGGGGQKVTAPQIQATAAPAATTPEMAQAAPETTLNDTTRRRGKGSLNIPRRRNNGGSSTSGLNL